MNHDEYSWLFHVGFWIGLGLIQACAVAFIILYTVGKTVNYVYSLFKNEDVSKYAFTVLPAHYNSMTVVFNNKTKELKAIAVYTHKGQINARTCSRYITDPSGLETFAYNLQLSLMTSIAKETKSIK